MSRYFLLLNFLSAATPTIWKHKDMVDYEDLDIVKLFNVTAFELFKENAKNYQKNYLGLCLLEIELDSNYLEDPLKDVRKKTEDSISQATVPVPSHRLLENILTNQDHQDDFVQILRHHQKFLKNDDEDALLNEIIDNLTLGEKDKLDLPGRVENPIDEALEMFGPKGDTESDDVKTAKVELAIKAIVISQSLYIKCKVDPLIDKTAFPGKYNFQWLAMSYESLAKHLTTSLASADGIPKVTDSETTGSVGGVGGWP